MIAHLPRLEIASPLPKDCRYLHIQDQDIILNGDLRSAFFDEPLVEFDSHRFFHVGQYNQDPVIAVDVDDLNHSGSFPIKKYLVELEPTLFQLISAACYCLNFHKNNLFCGSCGHKTEHSLDELAKCCRQCGRVIYPQYSPAVIILIERDDQILLARSPHFPEGMYSALAGFIDPGESAEQTVAREAFEEVAIRVNNITYFGTQTWPFPTSYMIGYRAQYESGDIQLQLEEIEDAKWFRRDELDDILLPVTASLSGQLIEEFRSRI